MRLSKIDIFFVLIIFGFVYGCSSNGNNANPGELSGFWMSGGIEIDPEVYQSSASVFHFNPEGYYRTIDYNSPDSVFSYEVRGDSIILNEGKGLIEDFQIRKNLLLFGKRYKYQWIKLGTSTNRYDKDQLNTILQQNYWKSDYESLNFESDTVIINSLRNRTKTQRCYEIRELDGQFFIHKKGNRFNCNPPHGFLEFILDIDEERFRVLTWDNGAFKVRTYQRSFDFKEYAFQEFEKCNPLLYRNSPSDRYYFKYTRFPGGSYSLKKVYENSYECTESGVNSGLVRIGFVVNCAGQIGEFEVLEFDENYNIIKMNRAIRNQLVRILKEAGDWIPGERGDQVWDSYKFVNFRIKDGEIEEIYY